MLKPLFMFLYSLQTYSGIVFGIVVEPPPQDSRPEDFYCYQCTPLQAKMLNHHNALRKQEGAANMNELVSKY